MTRKDYILIAEAFQRVRKGSLGETSSFVQCIQAVLDALAADNPRFDRAHFLAVVRGEKELTSKPEKPALLTDGHVNWPCWETGY